MKIDVTLIVLAIVSLILISGCINVYHNDGGNYSFEGVFDEDGTVSFSLSGPSSQYRYSLYTGIKVPEKIFLYLDDRYASSFNDYYTQSEYFEVMKTLLERRGYSSVFYADSEDLKRIMSSEFDCAVYFVSGNIPDTVAGTIFENWMNNGGTVYWSGPEVGRYTSTMNGVIDNQTGYFEGDVNNDKTKLFAYNESAMFAFTQARYDDCLYSLKADRANSLALAYISDEGYSSVTVSRLFNGNITVFGGNSAASGNTAQVFTDRSICADLLICGLTHESQGIEYGSGTLNERIEYSTTTPLVMGNNNLLMVSVGSPASNWGRTLVF